MGALRNQTLDLADGPFVAQWDDDDWYHAERLERQIAVLQAGADACTLDASLMHLSAPPFARHPYVGVLKGGVPGSIVHRRDDTIRYPEQRRAEDTVFREQWRARRYATLPRADAYLFIRAFHGTNTWEAEHFLRRIRNGPSALAAYAWHTFVRRDVTGHPRFSMTADMRRAFDRVPGGLCRPEPVDAARRSAVKIVFVMAYPIYHDGLTAEQWMALHNQNRWIPGRPRRDGARSRVLGGRP